MLKYEQWLQSIGYLQEQIEDFYKGDPKLTMAWGRFVSEMR